MSGSHNSHFRFNWCIYLKQDLPYEEYKRSYPLISQNSNLLGTHFIAMKFSIATALAAILLAQSANAWVFTWRESNGRAHVHDGGDSNKGCTKISHGAGQVFSWDRGFFSDCCISLYSNNACTGDPQGYSCKDWSKASSGALKSYKVTHC